MMKSVIIKTEDGLLKFNIEFPAIPRTGEFVEISQETIEKDNMISGKRNKYKNGNHRFLVTEIIHFLDKPILIMVK